MTFNINDFNDSVNYKKMAELPEVDSPKISGYYDESGLPDLDNNILRIKDLKDSIKNTTEIIDGKDVNYIIKGIESGDLRKNIISGLKNLKEEIDKNNKYQLDYMGGLEYLGGKIKNGTDNLKDYFKSLGINEGDLYNTKEFKDLKDSLGDGGKNILSVLSNYSKNDIKGLFNKDRVKELSTIIKKDLKKMIYSYSSMGSLALENIGKGKITKNELGLLKEARNILGSVGISDVSIGGQVGGQAILIGKTPTGKYIGYDKNGNLHEGDKKTDILNKITNNDDIPYYYTVDENNNMKTYINYNVLKTKGGKDIKDQMLEEYRGAGLSIDTDSGTKVKIGDSFYIEAGISPDGGYIGGTGYSSKNLNISGYGQTDLDKYATVGISTTGKIPLHIEGLKAIAGLSAESTVTGKIADNKINSVGGRVQIGGGVEYNFRDGSLFSIIGNKEYSLVSKIGEGYITKQKIGLGETSKGVAVKCSNGDTSLEVSYNNSKDGENGRLKMKHQLTNNLSLNGVLNGDLNTKETTVEAGLKYTF